MNDYLDVWLIILRELLFGTKKLPYSFVCHWYGKIPELNNLFVSTSVNNQTTQF